jgi:hypothetical protein
MGEPGAKSDRIEQLRRRAAEAAERAKHARTDELRQILEELAEAYEEMANSVAQLEALWTARRTIHCEQGRRLGDHLPQFRPVETPMAAQWRVSLQLHAHHDFADEASLPPVELNTSLLLSGHRLDDSAADSCALGLSDLAPAGLGPR